ncbi:MAG: citryl-CoA lyase [Gammaproteobacteria bacterium]|nr:MAG: citryl-CoA lyase [Gammaproteobacteria bacterium]
MDASKTRQTYEWRTGIATYSDKQIVIRGYDLIDLIDHIDFAGAVYLVLNGILPTKRQSAMLNAILVSTVDHGIAPSEAVARYVAASGVPLQACVAAGLLTIGDTHGGAGEEFAHLLQDGVATQQERALTASQMAAEIVARWRLEKRRLPGFGHPLHPSGDPRAPRLLAVAERLQISGAHVQLAQALGDALHEAIGTAVPINIDGATGAILSDLGFSWRVARPVLLISRAAGLSAHAIEEITREKGWRGVPGDRILYDGPELRQVAVEG